MLYLLISFLSFLLLLLSKSFSRKRLPPWERNMSFLSAFLVSWFHKRSLHLSLFQVLNSPLKNIPCSSKLDKNVEEELKEGSSIGLLDLPELALESILDRLSPAELCKMATVCSHLRDVCGDDHLWEKRMKQKWGKLMGDSARQEWHMHMAHRRKSEPSIPSQKRGLLSSYFGGWCLVLIRPKSEYKSKSRRSCLPIGSIKAWYLSLESGKLWFPAQVYNRQVIGV